MFASIFFKVLFQIHISFYFLLSFYTGIQKINTNWSTQFLEPKDNSPAFPAPVEWVWKALTRLLQALQPREIAFFCGVKKIDGFLSEELNVLRVQNWGGAKYVAEIQKQTIGLISSNQGTLGKSKDAQGWGEGIKAEVENQGPVKTPGNHAPGGRGLVKGTWKTMHSLEVESESLLVWEHSCFLENFPWDTQVVTWPHLILK